MMETCHGTMMLSAEVLIQSSSTLPETKPSTKRLLQKPRLIVSELQERYPALLE